MKEKAVKSWEDICIMENRHKIIYSNVYMALNVLIVIIIYYTCT